MEIFKLVGSVMVDTADAQKSIAKTSDEAEGLGKKLVSGAGTAAKWAGGLVAGCTAVGGAMVSAAKSTAEEMDVIDKASQRMKMGAESYQELAYAAELSGVQMTTLEAAAKKLEGTGLNMDQALEEIYSLETAEERAAKAAELFGEATAYKMTPLLNASAEDMAAMKQEAHDLGLVMSEEAVKNGAEMGDMFAKVEKSVAALKTSLTAEFMPYVMEILDWVIENLPQVSETVKSVMDAILPIVKPVLQAVMQLLPPIMEAIQKLMNWIIPFIKPIINAISSLVEGFTALMDGDIKGFVNGIIDFLTGIIGTFLKLGEDIFKGLWEGLKNVWNSIASWVSEKVNWLIDKIAFWRRGSSETGEGEAHAGGLPFVPYDNYPALLHRGETVLTASDSQNLLSNIEKIAGSGLSNTYNITVNGIEELEDLLNWYQSRQVRARMA